MIKIEKLYIYPVKSLAGIEVNASKLTGFGLEHDRRCVIIDEDNNFLSQRSLPEMATIKTSFKKDQLVLTHEDSSITVPSFYEYGSIKSVKIWNDKAQAKHLSLSVDKWLSTILKQKCHLVYMQETVRRQVDTNFAPIGQLVSFADAFPILITSLASHQELNKRLNDDISINRFRPNIVISGVKPFGEDDLGEFTINNIHFKAVKKCSRCIMPTINQKTGAKDKAKILSELNKFRKIDGKVMFGQNIIFNFLDLYHNDKLSCGDEILLVN